MNGVTWLASYPKSGNTWLRLMLDTYLHQPKQLNINAETDVLLYSGRSIPFNDIIGVDRGDLTPAEVLAWRPDAFRAEIHKSHRPVIVKTHDARVFFAPLHPQNSRLDGLPTCVSADTPNAIALIPPDISRAALYLVRDPRDVVSSLAAYLGISVDEAIVMMGNDQQLMGKSWTQQAKQLWQFWSSWQGHVASWLAPAPFPIQVIRYEDMRADPAHALHQALAVLGIPAEDDRVKAAVAATTLENLRQQEEQFGFRDRAKAKRFFGTGLVGGWKSRLSPAQIQRIEADHRPMMEHLGYL